MPSKDTPPIFLAVANAVAVAAFPVVDPDVPEVLPVTFPVISPANPVAVKTPLLELNAKLEPDLGAKSPVAAVTNKGKQVVSLLSSATVTFVDVVAVALFPVQLPALPLAFPVTFPVISPAKPVAVKTPELELKARLLPDLGGRSPVAAVTNNGKQVVSEDSSATVTFVERVAVAELPVQDPELPDAFPVTLPVSGPLKPVAVNNPLDELNAKLLPVLGPKSPVAAVTNKGKQVVSDDSSATVISVGVAAVTAAHFIPVPSLLSAVST